MPAYGGYSLARDEKVVFIKGAVPGETVEAAIEERKRDYCTASVVRVIEPSEWRVEPVCGVFGRCGGCQLQYISHEKQLALKEEVLLDSLARIGGIETAVVPAISGRPWGYRQRAQFKISKENVIGFFKESSREVVALDQCPLMSDRINELFRKIREDGLQTGLSEIHISSGDTPVVLLKGRECDPALFERFIDIGVSGIACNGLMAYGGAYTGFDLNGARYTVSPGTFFQANWELNVKAVELAAEGLEPLGGKKVLDLYAGAGNFSIPLALRGAEVTAVEEDPKACEDGLRNVELNNLPNCRFVKSSAEKYRIKKKFDAIILDPPRLGLTGEVVKGILENPPSDIAYISCNPATLARDLKKLGQKYEVRSVRQIDFFPQTYHIETVSFLKLR